MTVKTKAYLALGSNLGSRQVLLAGARDALAAAEGVRVLACSPLYETAPVGGPVGQGAYLNAAVAVETTLSPGDLLLLCLEVERRFGRIRGQRWEARTLDVDLLLYGERVVSTPELELPHPRMHQRRFVLVPLNDIAPGVLHPVLGLSVSQMLSALPPEDGVRRFCDTW